MPFLKWHSRYSINVKEIDEHHQTMMSYVNELADAAREGKEGAVLPVVLEKLVNYTSFHFGREEELMSQCKYPRLKEHEAAHRELTEQVLRYHSSVISGEMTVIRDLLPFLRDWLFTHILKEDHLIGPLLNRNGIY